MDSQRENEFLQKLYEWSGYKNIELLFRGSRDGTTSNDFHKKCDNQGPTICLFKNDKDNIFGGFTKQSWTSDANGNYYSSPDSFIFTLINIHGTAPTKFINSDTRYIVYHYMNYGPKFGGGNDIYIPQNFNINSNCSSSFPHSYKDTLGKGRSIFTGDSNNPNFKLKEMEVFKLY